ncbi:hypothetical protein I552_6651 [Mycobacterium xenopi 3993]|nr:hypothetical protein I552_6651 [Mycobacterium xenopi 3993]
MSRVGEPFTGSRASTSGGDADGWRCWPRAIRAPFWLISDATLLWWRSTEDRRSPRIG